jgi:hypothetical protein
VAIAFRAVGARLKVDVSAGGSPQNVGMPAGHASGDLLLLTCVIDSQSHEGVATAGWNFLGRGDVGDQTGANPYPDLSVYWKVDNGAEPANVSMTFDTSSYPTGDPYVLACITAWSGTHATNPIGEKGTYLTTGDNAAADHPQLTTADANDWLVSVRAVSAYAARTFTCSGADAERFDDTDGFGELSMALYDSNAALVAGVQTIRTTTASGLAQKGSVAWSIAIRPAAIATAVTAFPSTATSTGNAFNPTATAQINNNWDACGVGMPAYTFAIDWNGDGDWSDTGEDVTTDILSGGVTIEYGRDQSRQLSPTKVGSGTFSLLNLSRKYSPENTTSVLYGDLDPAREMRGQVVFGGTTYPLARMRVDDYNIHADFENRTVDFTFSDGLKLIDGSTLSTEVLMTMRTGDLIEFILDEINWAGGRDIDPGATIVPFWWVEGTSAFSAIQDLVLSEGPPSIAYVSPDNTFVFRDRHHRILRTPSINSQGSFSSKALGDCTSAAPTGLSFTPPFDYQHGWRDIVNSVSFDVAERSPDAFLSSVWTSDDTIALAIGESRVLDASGSDPFINAVTPVLNTDYTITGAGTLNIIMSRTSGQSVTLTLLAIGGAVTVSNLQLRAQAIPVRRTTKVTRTDAGSITDHGERSYPNTAPWANAQDAYAIAGMIILHYAQRRPTVQLRLTANDPEHFAHIVNRMISDRIHIRNDEMLINDDFFIEQITHRIDRLNQTGKPPIHSVVFGCEKELVINANPFRFDVKGSGFDQGVFDPITSDGPGTVFIFDDPNQGRFDYGLYGT